MSAGTHPHVLRLVVPLLALALAAPARADEAHPAAGAHASCHQAPGAAAAPEAPAAGYVRSEQAYAIPDVTLQDDAGLPVRLPEALGANEPVMVNFIFTTCTAICPVMSRIFAGVPAALGAGGERLRMLSISIDPEHDTPARLRAYADRFGAGPRWRFLTGRTEDVQAVARAFGAYRGDKMSHQPLTLLRAAPGRPWIRLDGFASAEALAREYEQAVTR